MIEILRGQQGLGKYHLHPQYTNLIKSPSVPIQNVYSPEQIVERMKGNIQKSTTEKLTKEPQKQPESFFQKECARILIEEKRISFEPTLLTFTIIGSNERPHVIKLFPKEYSSCPSTALCYHIMAARMSVGIQSSSEKKKINLTQLRKNARSRKEKRSGRKCPRPGDCDIVPAPDAKSEAAENEILSNVETEVLFVETEEIEVIQLESDEETEAPLHDHYTSSTGKCSEGNTEGGKKPSKHSNGIVGKQLQHKCS